MNAAESAGIVAIDTETTGLDPKSARLQTVQLHVPGHGTEVVRIDLAAPPAGIGRLIRTGVVAKIFHHALFDLAFLYASFGFEAQQVRCTKVAAKVIWPGERDKHSLKGLLWYFDHDQLDKSEQTSDWTRQNFSDAQIRYAARDAEVLPRLHDQLAAEADAAGLAAIIERAWAFLPTQVLLESRGAGDVFTY